MAVLIKISAQNSVVTNDEIQAVTIAQVLECC